MPNRSLLPAIVLSAAFFASKANAQTCVKPHPPAIPDATIATDAQMSATLREMDAYDTAINAYLDCAYAEYSNSKKEGEAVFKRWNEAVDTYRLNN